MELQNRDFSAKTKFQMYHIHLISRLLKMKFMHFFDFDQVAYLVNLANTSLK